MGHTIADEIQPYVIDVARLAQVMDKALALVGSVNSSSHGVLSSLHPRNLEIDRDDVRERHMSVTLYFREVPKEPPYTAPETLETGELTVASNVYTMGVILRELVADRPDVPSIILGIIARATSPTPSKRFPSADAMARAIAECDWGYAPAYGPWLAAFQPAGAREREMLAALRADPDTRIVYADLLEQQGFDARATFLREEARGSDDDATWRALVSRAGLIGGAETCPRTWDALVHLPLHNIRRCPGCARPVFYSASVASAMVSARLGWHAAIDANVDLSLATIAFTTVPRSVLPAAYQPAPPVPEVVVATDPAYGGPLTGNLLTRLWRRLRRP